MTTLLSARAKLRAALATVAADWPEEHASVFHSSICELADVEYGDRYSVDGGEFVPAWLLERQGKLPTQAAGLSASTTTTEIPF